MNENQNKFLKNWEEIEKVKWNDYKKNTTFDLILNKSVYIESPKIHALQGIFKSVQNYYSNNSDPFNPPITHQNIYDLTISKDLLRISYNKLKSNKGAMTPGTTQSTVDGLSEGRITKLHQDLKTGTFKWNPTNRIEIPKPGRAKGITRPLGLPDFTDKLVQNNITLILNSIYEPEFSYLNCNYGFRPNMSCNNAIKQIRMNTNGMDIAIEGDIIGAYDNLQHHILIKILRKRIKDEKFLKLIYDALKAGYMKDYTHYDTFLGTPQGGIHSPILFNIYMNEFDKYIKMELPKLIIKWNQKKNNNEYNPQSQNISKKIRRLKPDNKKYSDPTQIMEIHMSSKDRIEIFKNVQNLIPEGRTKKTIKKNIDMLEGSNITPEETLIFSKYEYERKNSKNTNQKIIDQYPESIKKIIKNMNSRAATYVRIHTNIKKLILTNNLQIEAHSSYQNILTRKIKQEKQKQLKLSIDPERKNIEIKYYRYADDWILFIRGTLPTAKTVKKILELWLKNNLKLQLSPEKTLITNIKENKAHFLGFEIFHQINKQIVRRQTKHGTFLQRYGKIQIMPDVERLTKKFKIQNYITKNDKILSIGFLTPLEDHQIIKKYNEFIMGLGLYYITEISRPSSLNKWHYILYYSCLKTLAHKHRTSISKIIKQGYIDISDSKTNENQKLNAYQKRIVRSYKKQDGTKIYITLLNYQEMMMNLQKVRKKYRNSYTRGTFQSPTIDFLRLHKNNWRTQFMLNSMCAICASTYDLEMHHIKPIKKSKSKGKLFNRFDQIVGSLGRKQICVCRTCHNKITHGQYNDTSLKDLIDIRIVAPEGLLRTNLPNNTSINNKIKKQSTELKINENERTYFNSELQAYLLSKKKTNI